MYVRTRHLCTSNAWTHTLHTILDQQNRMLSVSARSALHRRGRLYISNNKFSPLTIHTRLPELVLVSFPDSYGQLVVEKCVKRRRCFFSHFHLSQSFSPVSVIFTCLSHFHLSQSFFTCLSHFSPASVIFTCLIVLPWF